MPFFAKRFCLVYVLLSGCVSTGPIVHDSGDPPPVSGDLTLVVSGCGNEPKTGFLVCRYPDQHKTEGAGFRIHKPPNSVGDYRIVGGDGAILHGDKVQDEHTHIYWKDILKTQQFLRDQRGIYGVTLELEGRRVATGIVMLRVLAPTYTPLQNVKKSSQLNHFSSFHDTKGRWLLQYSDDLRAAVSADEP